MKCIFVNIFGGILSCKTIAEGICKACQLVDFNVPLVVRLIGNASDDAKKLIEKFAKDNKLNIQATDNMADGARLAVKAV